MRNTATWAPDESAISAASLHLAAVRDDDRPAVLGGVADDRHDHGGDEEVREVRLLRERLDRADEDLRDQRGDHRRGGEHADCARQRPDSFVVLGRDVLRAVPAELPPRDADVEHEQEDRHGNREHGE